MGLNGVKIEGFWQLTCSSSVFLDANRSSSCNFHIDCWTPLTLWCPRFFLGKKPVKDAHLHSSYALQRMLTHQEWFFKTRFLTWYRLRWHWKWHNGLKDYRCWAWLIDYDCLKFINIFLHWQDLKLLPEVFLKRLRMSRTNDVWCRISMGLFCPKKFAGVPYLMMVRS